MRVLAQMVVRNEADRYLDAVLEWHTSFLDGIHVFDDHSTDTTVDLALSHGCQVTRRPNNVATFLAHEGQFREAAWRAFEDAMHPVDGDWVLALDADEILVAKRDEVDVLYDACREAEELAAVALLLPVPEVFKVEIDDDGFLTRPKVRLDGFWGRIAGTRLFRYQPGGVFADKAMGSGSEPTYIQGQRRHQVQGLWLLHYGYAERADAEAKYARYSSMLHGHADSHIASIIEEPVLQTWDGPHISLWRGERTRS